MSGFVLVIAIWDKLIKNVLFSEVKCVCVDKVLSTIVFNITSQELVHNGPPAKCHHLAGSESSARSRLVQIIFHQDQKICWPVISYLSLFKTTLVCVECFFEHFFSLIHLFLQCQASFSWVGSGTAWEFFFWSLKYNLNHSVG